MIVYLSVLICIIGLVIYLIAGNPPSTNPVGGKVAEVGRIMFFSGLLAFLLNGDALMKIIETGRR